MHIWWFYLQVFLEYYDAVGCATAKNALSGRKFGGNTVNAFYYPEDKYFNKDYSAWSRLPRAAPPSQKKIIFIIKVYNV